MTARQAVAVIGFRVMYILSRDSITSSYESEWSLGGARSPSVKKIITSITKGVNSIMIGKKTQWRAVR
ncbi:hypothetical protein FQZ97_1072340 [compost metagenome]